MAKRRPNILFLTTDQQRWDTLGCYGNDLVSTPCLDALAQEGVRFDRAYCQSPICIPSRVSMITGKTAQHHGATLHNTSMRADEHTLGEALAHEGYHTHFIGKAHFSAQQFAGSPESIADWRAGLRDGWNGPYAGFQSVELILGHSNPLVAHYGDFIRERHDGRIRAFMAESMRSIPVTSGQGVYESDVPEDLYSSTYVADRTCAYLESQAASDAPFYCFASFPDPHWPICPPHPWFHMYDGIPDERIAARIAPYAGERDRACSPDTFRPPWTYAPYDGGGHYMSDPRDAIAITRAYWGAISLIDKSVGRMLDALDRLGMAEDTIVVFTADHGEYMGAHGMMAKGGYLWEEFIRVPLLVRYPAAIAPRATDAYASLIDVVPTLLDLCGVPADALACDGVSQAPVLRGDADAVRDGVLVAHFAYRDEPGWPDQHAILSGHMKLVYHAGTGKGELYDLKNDPHEQDNLYENENYQRVSMQMRLKLLDGLILSNDRQAVRDSRGADGYGEHTMIYDAWKAEFDALLPS